MDNLGGKILFEGYTFDDVLLVPQKSEVLPSQVSTKTFLTKDISLNIPIMSSAMDTVTEAKMAISMARQGGIGIIHKNMSIEDQAKQVDMVKRNENGMITNPIVLNVSSTLEDAETILATYKISGLPIVDSEQKLIGIITNRDLKYRAIDQTPVAEIMTKENLITAKENVTIEEAKAILLAHRIEKLPIVGQDGTLKGLITIKDIDNMLSYPDACKDRQGRLRVGAAVGVSDDLLERVKALYEAEVDVVTLDSAHGHSVAVLDAVRIIKKHFPDLPVIGGNIVTKEAALDLASAGADAVKVGIGPGSICTTRVVAGVGMPQLSAISEVYNALKDTNVKVIADGGIKYSGDIIKALAIGADCVMLGSLLAGVEESPGEEILYEGRKYKAYIGMGSLLAMARGSKDRYFQTGNEAKKLVPEGIEGRVSFKGSLEDVIYQLIGGVKSGMGYCGTESIGKLHSDAKFVRISQAGLIESHPHDINITKQAPNYWK